MERVTRGDPTFNDRWFDELVTLLQHEADDVNDDD
jgi:hypothetical protein